jgi:rod shape determining protein RodA
MGKCSKKGRMNLSIIHKTETHKAVPVGRIVGFFTRFDFMQLIPMLSLLLLGVYYIYSTGQQIGGNPDIWKKQLFFVCVGFAIWTSLSFINYRIWRQLVIFIYITALIVLSLVLVFGEVRYGARRWFSLFGRFSVQPSEFAKLAVLMMSAWILSLRNFNINNLKHVIGLLLVTLVPFVLILIEPDLGSSIILWPVVMILLFVANIKWKWILIALVAFVILAPPSYIFLLKGYQKERILVFLDPGRDPNNKGWNSRQSQIAVGSGGFWGKGAMQSTQTTLGFLPKTVSNSDFIFSVIAEETGFVGSSIVIFLYVMLILSTFRTAILVVDPFGRYLAIGIGSIIFIHSAVNIGMTIRLMPVTGLPLPLVSLGGSFIISTMISLGLLQSVYIYGKGEE